MRQFATCTRVGPVFSTSGARRVAIVTAALVLCALVLCALGCTEDPPSNDEKPDVAKVSTTPAAERSTAAYEAAKAIPIAFVEDRVTVLADDSMQGRDNLTEGGKAARTWLLGDLKNLGLAPAFAGGFEQAFDKGINLCFTIPGDDEKLAAEYVVIGAHYDHLGMVDATGKGKSKCPQAKDKDGKPSADTICNGAIDNAAGVAAVLLVAKALKTAKHKTRRSVIGCLFDAEEDGLLGSYHFVANPPVPLDQIVAMFSVDNVGSRIFSDHTSSFATDAEYSKALRDHVLAASKRTGFQTWPVSSFFVGQPGGGRSDHLPFRQKGIPVLFFGSGSSSVYHTTADQLSSVDFTKLLATARHAALVTADVANHEDRPDFSAKPKPHLDDARAMVAIADKVIANPKGLGLNDAQVDLLKTWRADLQKWLDKPPTTAAQWKEYDDLVRGIITAVYVFGA